MKIKLYLDFDGVILNTIDITYKLLGELDLKDHEEIEKFYRQLDWYKLLEKSVPIKNSINNIKKLISSGKYDVSVLSHVVSKKEALAKKDYLSRHVPGLKFISVNRDLNKCDVVDCKNKVLVDDYMGNLELWYEKGGVPVKFSDKGKKYNYMTITSLSEMLDKYDEIVELVGINQ